MMQPCKKRIERKANTMTIAEILKAKGIDDAVIKEVQEEMKQLWRIVFDNDRAVAAGIYEVLKGMKI